MVIAVGMVIGAGARSRTSNYSTRASFAQIGTEIKMAGSKLLAKSPLGR